MNLTEIETLTNQQLFKHLGFSIEGVENTPNGFHNAMKKIKSTSSRSTKALCLCEFVKRWSTRPVKQDKAFTVPEEIYEYFKFRLGDEKQEHLYVIFLDHRYRFIGEHLVSKGSFDLIVAAPRDVFRKAIEEEACYVIAAHNHPGNSVSPSQADIDSTHRLVEAGKVVGIDVIDHIIVGHDDFFSMKRYHLL